MRLFSPFAIMAAFLAPLQAADWTLAKIRGQWGLRLPDRQFLTLDGRQVRATAKPTDSLELRLCSDSLDIVPEPPDSSYPQGQEWRTLHGPFRFGSWIRSPHPVDIDDLRAGTGIDSPWRKVWGTGDSGFVNLKWVSFCASQELLARLDKPTLVRHPFLGVASGLLASPASPPRSRRVATGANRLVPWPGDTSFAVEAPDTLAEDDFRPAGWLVWWPSSRGERWIAGKQNLVQIRQAGKPAGFIHFQDLNPRIAQRVAATGPDELAVEWTALYGDGNWDELARIGTRRFQWIVLGGTSGGEGHEISAEEEKRAAPGTWRIDSGTGKVLLKKWRAKERAILAD